MKFNVFRQCFPFYLFQVQVGKKRSSNHTNFSSLLSALRLAGWQKDILSSVKVSACYGAGRPWLHLEPWLEAAVFVSGGTACVTEASG